MMKRSKIFPLFIVLVLALSLRIILARYETEVGVDSVHYVLMGDNIAHGKSWDTWNTTGGRWVMPPLFPLIIAIFRLMGTGLEWSGHLAAAFCGTALLLPLYILTKRLYGEREGLAAAWIAAFTPILVDYSVVILTECLFAGCILSMMVQIHKAFSKEGRALNTFWSGFWLGLAFLTKTFSIIFLPFMLLSFLFTRGGKPRLTSIKQCLLAFVGFLLLAIPYWISLRIYSGRWEIDGKGIGQESRIYTKNLEEEHVDPRYSGELTPDGSDFLINASPHLVKPERPGRKQILLNFLVKYLQKLIRIYQDFPFTPTYPNNVLILYLFPAMLLGIGLFSGKGSWKERPSDRFLLYWLCPFIFGLPLIFVEVRYYIPTLALLVPFMAVGATKVALWIERRFYGKEEIPEEWGRSMTIVILAFVLLATPKLTYKITNWDNPMVSYNPRKEAAKWLLENGYRPKVIMEYGHSVSFYSGAKSILIPQGGIEDVIRIANKYGAEILSLDEFYVLRSNRRPQLVSLFSSTSPLPPQLERIYVDERYPELHHYLYRIHSTSEIEQAE